MNDEQIVDSHFFTVYCGSCKSIMCFICFIDNSLRDIIFVCDTCSKSVVYLKKLTDIEDE